MAVFALLIFTIDVIFTCGLEYYRSAWWWCIGSVLDSRSPDGKIIMRPEIGARFFSAVGVG